MRRLAAFEGDVRRFAQNDDMEKTGVVEKKVRGS